MCFCDLQLQLEKVEIAVHCNVTRPIMHQATSVSNVDTIGQYAAELLMIYAAKSLKGNR